MTELQMYFLITLDALDNGLKFLAAASIATAFITFMIATEVVVSQRIKLYKMVFISIFAFVFFVIAATLLPSTKQMATILVVPNIMNNETVKNLPDKVVNLADLWLDELKPKSKKEKTSD